MVVKNLAKPQRSKLICVCLNPHFTSESCATLVLTCSSCSKDACDAARASATDFSASSSYKIQNAKDVMVRTESFHSSQAHSITLQKMP